VTIKYNYTFDKRVYYSVLLRDGGVTQCQSFDYDGSPIMLPSIEKLRWAMLWSVKRGVN